MREQAFRVLEHLRRHNPDSAENIGRVLGCPAASVRRSIQELWREGFLITSAGPDGLYRLTERRGA